MCCTTSILNTHDSFHSKRERISSVNCGLLDHLKCIQKLFNVIVSWNIFLFVTQQKPLNEKSFISLKLLTSALTENIHTVTGTFQSSPNNSSGSSGRVRGGRKNMKSMRPPLVAIFFMTYFYRTGGGGAWPPRPPGSATELHHALWNKSRQWLIQDFSHGLERIYFGQFFWKAAEHVTYILTPQ